MSRGYSRVILVGNLGRDPEMRYTPQGTPVTNFSIAVNRRRGTGDNAQDETDWYRISVFGRQAEVADQYLKRGMKVLVDGRLAIRSYVGNDGVERTSVEVTADNFQMLTTRDEMEAGFGGGSPARDRQYDDDGAQRAPAGDRADRREPNFDDDEEDLDDVPF